MKLRTTTHDRRRRTVRLGIETLEERCVPSGFRSLDGTGNNLLQRDWGSAGGLLARVSPADYGDGISTPAGATRPSARQISNAIIAETDELLNDRALSDFIYVFGQMLDHDLDLTLNANPAEPFPVPVPTGDPFFDLGNTGTQVIGMNRSKFGPTTGTSTLNPREQVNEVTAWLDGSVIYGSSASRARALRTLVGGRLKTSAGNMLPFNTMGLDNQVPFGSVASDFFLAGDRRVNENIELTALQTVWMREHNRLAGLIQRSNRLLSDEQIYQRARRLVVAEFQHVVYNEFLPALLGSGALQRYRGYNPAVNPAVANEFSTVAFRVGHTLLGDDVEFLNNDGREIREELPLSEAFFNPGVVRETGIEPILKYLATDKAREVDPIIVGGVRNFLFGPPGAGGFDLAALDIQRGRDHGLADYNTMRVAFGLPRVSTFAQITSDSELQQQLSDLYGSVDDIDAFIGGLAENHAPGASVGPLFQRIIAEQFERTRDGDRFWYERNLTPTELRAVRATTLAAILRRNTSMANIQDQVFFFEVNISGKVFFDLDRDGRLDRAEPGLPTQQVELRDEGGAVLATTHTSRDGTYSFAGRIDGPGNYSVYVSVPEGWSLTTDWLHPIRVTRGQKFTGLNFGLFPA